LLELSLQMNESGSVGRVLLGIQGEYEGLDLPCLDGMGKILNKTGLALDAPISQLTDLFRVEALPGASIQIIM